MELNRSILPVSSVSQLVFQRKLIKKRVSSTINIDPLIVSNYGHAILH